MRKLLQQISDQLQAFINQRDNLALVLCSSATDAMPMLKMLEGIEETSTSDFFWTFTDNFVHAEAYASAVIKTFATTHGAVQLMMEKEHMIPWPSIPPLILSEGMPPVQRLRALATFSRELLPIRNGGVVVWTFFPLEMANPLGFATLMADVLQHEFPFPWCHHLRFLIRDDPTARALHKVLGQSPRLQWYEPDLSAAALNQSMEQEVNDESLPLEERLSLLTIMAGNDFAFQRYDAALEKYELLLQYYGPMGNYPLAALALNGMGEVYEKMGELEQASESYEAALIPASHGDNPAIPIFLNVVLNLANLRLAQARWEDAEAYFDMAQQLATVTRDAALKIRSVENCGICQQQQGKLAEACKSWNDGLIMAAQLEDVALCRSLLGRLRQHYAETHQTDKERELQEQLAAFDA